MQDLLPYFHALDDKKRLAIVQYLSQHEQVTVTQLGEELRLSQPLISWHLMRLRRADVVQTRRAGRQAWCSLNRASIQRYQDRVAQMFGLSEASASLEHEGTTVFERANR